MLIEFTKYQGAGNDFIIIDGRLSDAFLCNTDLTGFLQRICNRNFGIGADGVILLLTGQNENYFMKYYNSDGREGTMCGNGGRCFTAFAHSLGLTGFNFIFEAIDGVHQATINSADGNTYDVSLKLNDVCSVVKNEHGILVDTGSPHLVVFANNLSEMDVVSKGKEIRYSGPYAKNGINVNFVQVTGQNSLRKRTYERGVENETLACGTGAVAAAIATKIFKNSIDSNFFEVEALGGKLEVSFETENNNEFRNVWLRGPAQKVFEGKVIFKGNW